MTVSLERPAARVLNATSCLNAAAYCWFVVALAGQLVFAFYVASSYGRTAFRGDWQAWNHSMSHGYVPGQTLGNAAVALHLIFAVLIILSGALQLIPQLRSRAPRFHRWNGRIYVPTAFAISAIGLYLIWFRGSAGDNFQRSGTTLNAILIMLFAWLAWRTAIARQFGAHRRWALRLFLVVSGVWFFRIGLMFWLFVNHGPAGFDPKTFTGPALTILAFAQTLFPLAVLESYLRAQSSTVAARGVMALALFTLTAGTGVGIVIATMGLWLPHL